MKNKLETAARHASTLAGYRPKIAADVAGQTVYECGFKKGTQWQRENMWISVEEELPKEGEKVWVKDGLFDLCPLVFSHGKFWIGSIQKCYSDRVTHWMPIPELKKGE
jgi:hypothetical protein